jgi:cell division protein FtsB
MDNNFIKDNRVFPEEMHGSNQEKPQTQKNHSMSVVKWIIGLLVLLVLVFFVGLWAGQRTANLINDRDADLLREQQREERIEQIAQQEAYRDNVTSEQRNERLRNLFGE